MAKVQSVNFNDLWDRMISETRRIKDDRTLATFLNHSSKKEYICRKFGITSITDISRTILEMEKRGNRS